MIRRALLLLALAGAIAAATAPAAGAHAVLESTVPERGAALDAPPDAVVFRFSEAVEIAFGAVRVYAADGTQVQEGDAYHPDGDDRSVAVRLRGGLADGGYTATYRVVSADSHPISGGFVFGVGDGGAAGAATVGDLLDGASAGPVTSVAFGVVRALQFAAIAVAVGALAVLLLVWLPALAALVVPGGGWDAASGAFAARWRRVLLAAAAAGLAASVLGIVLQAATAAGTTFWSALGEASEVLGTRFGTVWGIGALAWVAVGALALPRAGPRAAALALPLLWLVLLPALGGHASVQEPVAVLLPANVLHVVAASCWIGGLAVLVAALPAATRRLEPPDRTRLLAGTLGRFSVLALASVAALLLGGILQSVLELDAWDDLLDTAYGRAIVVKSALVALLLGAGWLNRRRTLPALDRAAADGGPPGRPGRVLRRTLRAEVALGVAALAVTGALAGYSPSTAASTGPWSGSADLGPARAELTVEPALAGPNEVHVYFFDRADGRQWDATRELTVRASLPDRDIAPIALEPRKAGPGHYVIGGAPLAPAGDWTLEFVARVSEFDEHRATFEVPIR